MERRDNSGQFICKGRILIYGFLCSAFPHAYEELLRETAQSVWSLRRSFLPQEGEAQRAEMETALAAQGIDTLRWRPIPVRPDVLGEIANAMRPTIWHLLTTSDEPSDFNRRLFLARKQFERSGLPGYVASISASTMVYK